MTGVNLPRGASIEDLAGDGANLSGASAKLGLQIDTTAPTISSVATSGAGITSGNGDLDAGKTVTLTVNFSEAVTVRTAGGTPFLTLNNGGKASYTGGSGSVALTFTYTVVSGQNTPDVTVTAFNLNGATVEDAAGNNASFAGALPGPAGKLIINTTPPTVTYKGLSGKLRPHSRAAMRIVFPV